VVTDKTTHLELPDPAQRRDELRNVIAMTVPVVITTTSRAMMDVADYVMITGLHSDYAQAAILPAQMVMFTYIVLGMGTVSVVSTFVSQSLGRKKPRECGAYAWQVLYMAGVLGVIGVLLRPVLPHLVALFDHEPGVQVMEVTYARIAMLTVAPTTAAMGLAWYFIGIHRPRVAMWSALEANVVNIGVSLVLIYGNGAMGIEPMGIAGAAWGTLVGVSYRTARLVVSLMTPSMEARFASRSGWKPSWSKLRGLLRVGTPCGLHWVSEVAVWALFVNVLIGTKFGTAHLIATSTAWQYIRLSFMPTVGVGQALTSLVGKSIGAGHRERAIREARTAFVIALAYMGTLSATYLFFGKHLIALFNDNQEVVRIGAQVMICAAVFQLFDAVGITYNAALRGAGDTFWPSVFSVVSNWVLIIGGGWAMACLFPELKYVGPWIAASLLIVAIALFLWFRWHRRGWMKINLFDDEPDDADVHQLDQDTSVADVPPHA